MAATTCMITYKCTCVCFDNKNVIIFICRFTHTHIYIIYKCMLYGVVVVVVLIVAPVVIIFIVVVVEKKDDDECGRRAAEIVQLCLRPPQLPPRTVQFPTQNGPW